MHFNAQVRRAARHDPILRQNEVQFPFRPCLPHARKQVEKQRLRPSQPGDGIQVHDSHYSAVSLSRFCILPGR